MTVLRTAGWLSVPRDFDEFLKDRKETVAYGTVKLEKNYLKLRTCSAECCINTQPSSTA